MTMALCEVSNAQHGTGAQKVWEGSNWVISEAPLYSESDTLNFCFICAFALNVD